MEFPLIKRFFGWNNNNSNNISSNALVKLSIGDDGAVVRIGDKDWVISTDTMVSGVHMDDRFTAADIAHKLLAVNVSDIVAMGATPSFFTLNITLPSNDDSWLAEFSHQLQQCAQQWGVQLIGGDTTQGPLSLTVTMWGQVANTKGYVTRAGAQAGDIIAVTGSLGGAAAAVAEQNSPWLTKLLRPQPRYLLAAHIAQWAHAAIDISDGLLQDLSHILQASKLSAKINLDNIPCDVNLDYALYGGDDYELLLVVDAQQWSAACAQAAAYAIPLTAIGSITANQSAEQSVNQPVKDLADQSTNYQVELYDAKTSKTVSVAALQASGWQHFS